MNILKINKLIKQYLKQNKDFQAFVNVCYNAIIKIYASIFQMFNINS